MAVVAVAFWRPVQQKCTAYLLVHSDAPSEEVLCEIVEEAANPAWLLRRLWQTEKVPHRQFVAGYLSRVSSAKPELFRKLEPLVMEAAADPDVEVRELAFATLDRLKHPKVRRLALEQLSNADPAVRIIGLKALRTVATSNDVAIAMRFLKDLEPRVAVAAALVLREVTGQDFGIKSAHALPQFTCISGAPPPAPDVAAISQGVQRWQAWWAAHSGEFPPAPAFPPERRSTALKVADFSLPDSSGHPVHLSQFRGKAVLLAFWGVGAPASVNDAPALKAVHDHNSDWLSVLGISLPPTPSCADEHEHGQQGAHHHHASSAGKLEPDQMRVHVREIAQRLEIDFPVLVDAKGVIGSRFQAEDLPVYVLIDSRGMIRHRSVGFRTEQALASIVKEAREPVRTTQR